MSAEIHNHYHNHNAPAKKKYGLGKFLVDATLTVFTGGIWLIYVFVRESRNR